MAKVIEQRESGAEIVVESDDVVNARLERAVHAEGIHIVRGRDAGGDPTVILLMEMGECDALYALSPGDALREPQRIAEAVEAMT